MGAWSREHGRVTTNAAWVLWATGEVGSELKKDCMWGCGYEPGILLHWEWVVTVSQTDKGIIPVQSASSSPCVRPLHQLSPSSLFESWSWLIQVLTGQLPCVTSRPDYFLASASPHWALRLQPKPAVPVSVFSLAIAFSWVPSRFLHATVM